MHEFQKISIRVRSPVWILLASRSAAVVLLVLSFALFVRGQEQRPETVLDEPPVTDEDRDHWAFRPLQRLSPPEVKRGDLAITPVDRFILARLEAEGLSLMPPADRPTLIRRLAFDLTGLPPSPDEVHAFLVDRSADAYEKVVDRMLASHQYGQRWAQHWLDLARFAETDGFEHDKVRPEAWRYRDWVIHALNEDMPYDRFVRLQLAGDQFAPDDESARVATAFCLSGPDMPDINLSAERRHNLLNEMTATIGSVLLALQMGCAQCHDHKYDPISQADFYRLRAFFEPSVQLTKNKSVSVLERQPGQPPTSYLMLRGDFRRRGTTLEPAFPRIANPWNDRARGPSRRAALARWMTRPDHPLTTRVIANRLWQYHFGHGLVRTPSDFGLVGQEPSHPELLDWLATELVRREWSIKRMHQLIVTSAAYRQASRPAMRHWNDEQRRTTTDNWRRATQVDPENLLLARANRRRLEGETIRDAMLFSAGMLSARGGGPGVMPPLPKEMLVTLLKNQWNQSPDTEDHHRRSINLFARRNLRYPIFDVFDRPDANTSCPERSRSTTAPQSLLMLNSQFSLTGACHLAGHVLSRAGSDVDGQITLCYQHALGRRPSDAELEDNRQFLIHQRKLLETEGRRHDQLALPVPCPEDADPLAAAALTDLCLAIFNLSEFVYVD